MQIDLFDIVSNPGRKFDDEITIEMNEFASGMGSFPMHEKSPLRLTIKNNEGKTLFLKATGSLAFVAPCDRCLTDVVVPIELDYEREFELDNGTLVMDELDVAEFIEGLSLDTDQLVYDEILVNWPMKVLCKDDCKGICNKCGCNLNERTCDCDRTVVDPRMAAIQDVFNRFKEV